MTSTTQISLYQGNSATFQVTVKDNLGNPQDLTGGEIIFRIWTDYQTFLELKNEAAGGSDSEILIINPPADGIFQIYFVPENTESIMEGTYFYNIVITLGGVVKTLISSIFTIMV